MKKIFKRTVASELVLWLSSITSIIALLIGVSYYFYASGKVTSELIIDSGRTAEEFSRLLIRPLYNFDQAAALEAAAIYQASGRINGVRIQADGLGEIINTLSGHNSSIPPIVREIDRNGLHLGTLEISFDDRPVHLARKRVVWTIIIAVAVVLSIYAIALHFILGRILVEPLGRLGRHLQKISNGIQDGCMEPVPQEDLNTIVRAANRMSAEIAARTKILLENERNYREVYNATSDAIFIHDASDGTIFDVNQTALDMFGYSRKEILGLDIGRLSQGEPPYSRADALAHVRKALNSDGHVFTWRSRRKDGSLFWSEVALKKTTISDQEILLATVRDISERQRLEDQLQQSRKMEAIGTLAGGIAHDFNNILTAILGNSELARLKTGGKQDLDRHLEQIETASLRARDLIRQILTFSSRQKQEKKVMSPVPVVREALKLLRSTLPASISIDENLSAESLVFIDPGQLHQVIMNLCTNSVHSGADRLEITVQDLVLDGEKGAMLGAEAGEYVVLKVRDNGEGMTGETRQKIFEPYFSTREPDKGTGLGLSVVHGIVTSYQGVIDVDSRPGQGTVISVYLPVSTGEDQTPEECVWSPEVVGDARIMIVDDEASIRTLLEEMLTAHGYSVDFFGDGESAWQAFRRAPDRWDLLITDLTMPTMNGMELARKVAELRPDLEIILCTGYNELAGEKQPADAVISASLQKPLTVRELLAAVAGVLQTRQAATDGKTEG